MSSVWTELRLIYFLSAFTFHQFSRYIRELYRDGDSAFSTWARAHGAITDDSPHFALFRFLVDDLDAWFALKIIKVLY